jgi:DNA-binding transcriptional regulator YiaG
MPSTIPIMIFVPDHLSASQIRGRKIEAARKMGNFTQEQLAARLHRSVDTLRRWERGLLCPDLDDAHKISQILGQPPTFLN